MQSVFQSIQSFLFFLIFQSCSFICSVLVDLSTLSYILVKSLMSRIVQMRLMELKTKTDLGFHLTYLFFILKTPLYCIEF